MNDEIPLGSACSGYGGLEMGIGLAIPNLVTRWVADYEPPKKGKPQKQSAAKVLAHRYPSAPNLGDITIVNWPATAPVRVICAGTPCQDVSAAGARAGMRAGTRSGIWSSMVSAIEHHRPTLVIWENVRGALSAEADSNVEPCPICLGDERECTLRALGRVLGDLAELGYDTVWYGLPAAAIGAPHERFRVFVAAWPANPHRDPVRQQPIERAQRSGTSVARDAGTDPAEDPDVATRDQRGQSAPGQAAGGRARADAGRPDRAGVTTDPKVEGLESRQSLGVGETRPIDFGPHPATHTQGNGRDEGRTEPEGQFGGSDAAERSPDASTDPDRRGLEPVGAGIRNGEPDTASGRGTDWGPFTAAIARWEAALGRPAPRPTELTSRGNQALSAKFVEFMMGLPPGWVTDVPDLTRNEQLHVLGNGVVPQQAAAAVEYLLGFAPAWVRADLGLSTPSPTPVDNSGDPVDGQWTTSG